MLKLISEDIKKNRKNAGQIIDHVL
jgi:hypothetical protein